jgi:MFS transporter, ACS family, D-galactonate transporter
LLSPTILACWCANFGAYWGLSQALSWQGAFLIKELGLSQSSIGLLGALPAGATVVVVIAAGWYSQCLPARGVSTDPSGLQIHVGTTRVFPGRN